MTTPNRYLSVHRDVQRALHNGRPVVALESTIISHGMPYPQNVETAQKVELIVKDSGAVPATIAILGGRLCVGLTAVQIDILGKKGPVVHKASRRDIPVLVARGGDGATTVAATMVVAALAGVRVFATGGIGGVHRGAETTMDISADLEELAQTPVCVVCAGAKSILDLGLTLEYLETRGVPVIGYGTDELPAFYTRKSGFPVDFRMDSAADIARAFAVQGMLGFPGGMLVANPIPERYSMDADTISRAIDTALDQSRQQGIKGKALTPFLLDSIRTITGGESLAANIELVCNNARLASAIACALSGM
jgi:pseudouridine-5'-phosphate glycosidase